MVRLNKIYTRTGDDGSTGLGDGTRLPKHHPRVVAYGTLDELSSVLGLAAANCVDGKLSSKLSGWLLEIQNDLFDLGADLCTPGPGRDEEPGEKLRVTTAYTARLEEMIDEENETLAPLTSFVLPGGTTASAWLHLARNVCRRAERSITELCEMGTEAAGGGVNREVLKYVNRLSDLLFVLGRAANDGGKNDVLWKPGARQD